MVRKQVMEKTAKLVGDRLRVAFQRLSCTAEALYYLTPDFLAETNTHACWTFSPLHRISSSQLQPEKRLTPSTRLEALGTHSSATRKFVHY